MSLVQSPTLTEEKLTAQRSNARRSTGPRSPEGKSKSRVNALKHGGYSTGAAWAAETLRALGENPGELISLVASLKASDGPLDDPLWALAAEELARQIWRRRRLERDWEALALRHGEAEGSTHLFSLTEEGVELGRQLDAADRAVDRKTRTLIRLRENEARRRREIEASARRRMHQAINDPTSDPDSPTVEDLAMRHALVRMQQERTDRINRQTAVLIAEFEAAVRKEKPAERSHDVVEKKETEVGSQKPGGGPEPPLAAPEKPSAGAAEAEGAA